MTTNDSTTIDLSLANWTGPGADEFVNLPPDADLVGEWADHHRGRTAGRHPQQARYSSQCVDVTVAERQSPGGNGKPADVYELAKAKINGRGQWTGDLVLYDNGAGRVWVSEYQSLLILNWRKDGRHEQARAGYYSPRSGWTFSLTRAGYDAWVSKIQGSERAKPVIVRHDYAGIKSLRPSFCK